MSNAWSDEWESLGESEWGAGTKSTRLPRGGVLGATVYELPPGGRSTVHFPSGPDGAHEQLNHSDEPVRYVVVGNRVSPEVVEYPDLRQLTAQSCTTPRPASGSGSFTRSTRSASRRRGASGRPGRSGPRS